MARWKELEAEGVKRCCAQFTRGGQCRRRAVQNPDGSWDSFCVKHGPMIDRMLAPHVAALKASGFMAKDDGSADDGTA